MSDRMMKFKRKAGDSVVVKLGDQLVEFVVCKHTAGRVEVGVKAPDAAMILRGELWAKVVAEQAAPEQAAPVAQA